MKIYREFTLLLLPFLPFLGLKLFNRIGNCLPKHSIEIIQIILNYCVFCWIDDDLTFALISYFPFAIIKVIILSTSKLHFTLNSSSFKRRQNKKGLWNERRGEKRWARRGRRELKGWMGALNETKKRGKFNKRHRIQHTTHKNLISNSLAWWIFKHTFFLFLFLLPSHFSAVWRSSFVNSLINLWIIFFYDCSCTGFD